MKRLTLLTTLQCFFFISMLGQTIPIGKYIGYENMVKQGVFTELCLTFFFEEKNYTCLLRYLPTVGQGWQGT